MKRYGCVMTSNRHLDTQRRAELGGLPATLAGVLDAWLLEQHGLSSSHHCVGAFLDLLADEGLQVTPAPAEITEPLYVVVETRRGALVRGDHDEVYDVRPTTDLQDALELRDHRAEIAKSGGRRNDTVRVCQLVDVDEPAP